MKAFAVLVALAACSSSPKLPITQLEDPSTCMECHNQHYTEWSGSMHAYASDDPVFLAMNKRGQRETGNQLGTFCVQCHAPMAVALGLTDGTNFDPTTLPPQARGITCYFCHDVKSVQDDHNNGLVIAHDQTMRGGVHDPVESPAHNSLYDPKLMASSTNNSTMCGSCHDVVTPRGIALERTYTEWQSTIFATYDPQNLLPLTCTGCHMKSDPTTTVIADKPGLNVKSRPGSFHEHIWPAIDQAITPFPQTDVMTADIARDLSYALVIVGATPPAKMIGEGGICVTHEQTITVRMDTRNLGHMYPSGAAQDRRTWLEVIAYDAANNVVFSSGTVADNQDPEDLNDPNLFGLWDKTFTDQNTPAHFFWDVARDVPATGLRAPVTLNQNDPMFDHSSTATFPVGGAITNQIDHITARVRSRPYAYSVLKALVASGDLDASFASSITTLDIPGSLRHWTRATVDPATDGCDKSPFQ